MSVKLAVVSLRAEDVPQTVHFYKNVVGLQLVEQHSGPPHFDLAGTYLTIVKGQPGPVQEALHHQFPVLAFAVEDLDEAIAQLHQHEIDFPWKIEQTATSRWVKFYDPAGNLIEFVEFNQ